jgi:LuxR family maltose regulon positive regulatory protein
LRAEDLAHRALALLADDDQQLRAVVQVLPAQAAWLAGRLPEAEAALESAIANRQAEGLPRMAVRPLFYLGQVQQARGRLRAAAQTYRRGLAMLAPPDGAARRAPVPAAALQHLGLAEVLRQRGELDAALYQATEGVALSRRLFSTQAVASGLATLAWIHYALGDDDAARAAIDESSRAAPGAEVVSLLNPATAERARLLLALGAVDEVLRWPDEHGVSEEDVPSYPRERDYLVLARLLLARDAADRALPLLDRLRAAAAAEGRLGSVVEVRALQALALDAAGDPRRALEALLEALSLAQPEGYVRVFADEGAPMAALLRRLVAAVRRGHLSAVVGAQLDHAARLLVAVSVERAPVGHAGARTAASVPGLVEPLTEREHEVLVLVAAGEANREIAARLVVTPDTVKKHLTHVFGKLGAVSRTQAVARARALGILP